LKLSIGTQLARIPPSNAVGGHRMPAMTPLSATQPSVPSDLEIAQAARLEPIEAIAEKMGLARTDIELYGDVMAKVKLEALEKLAARPNAKYVVVTAITPTPLGEGKSTTTVGLGQAMAHIGKT